MCNNVPCSPLSTRLSGSAKEVELRIRSIFQWKKKRPPVWLMLVTAMLCLSCGSLVSCQRRPAEPSIIMETQYYDSVGSYIEIPALSLPAGERKEAVKKSCQRTFQALRIDVNSEFEVLYAFLEKLPHVLKPGGRAAILTFHSGEDRLVKQAFRQQYRDGLYSDIAQEVTRPSPQECRRNPRAHSTKLRWAVRAE